MVDVGFVLVLAALLLYLFYLGYLERKALCNGANRSAEMVITL